MLCGLGSAYYRLRNGEDVTGLSCVRTRTRNVIATFPSRTVSLKDTRMHPDPDTIRRIHSWMKKLGLDQVMIYGKIIVGKKFMCDNLFLFQTIDNPRKR